MAKRRANGEGCLYKRADGRWVGQYTVSPGKKKAVYGKTQQETRIKLKEALRSLEAVRMKKHEKTLNNLYLIDKASFVIFEKKIKCMPGSDEWEAYEATKNELEELAKQELAVLKKCITWYRQCAKTADDIKLIVYLEAEHNNLYEYLICDLTDDEINSMATKAAEGILEGFGMDSEALNDGASALDTEQGI